MNNNPKILITSYRNPDLDGCACIFAYAEFLRRQGKNVQGAVFGTPHLEAQFVFTKFKIPSLGDAEEFISEVDEMIIVDASDLEQLPEEIQPDKVIEVIDHRKMHRADQFPRAKVQIELVGAAATLIAERFYSEEVEMSAESAALLFSAVVSNTINFQAKVTTERDRQMADWLKSRFILPVGYIDEMFAAKSKFTKPLLDVFLDEFVVFSLAGYRLAIVQLEIVRASEFVNKNLAEIKNILTKLKLENSLDFIFLSCIDVGEGFNEIVVVDDQTKKLLQDVLKIRFKNGIGRRDEIIMRKEILPFLAERLSS